MGRLFRFPSLGKLLPKPGFDYGQDPTPFNDHRYAGFLVKAMMDAMLCKQNISLSMVDDLLEEVFRVAAKLAPKTESVGGLDNFWSIVVSRVTWLRSDDLI